MGQSLNKIYVHLVFSTKHRKPLITDLIKGELFSYLGGICKNLECNPIQVGGHHDHIHILCLLSKKVALMKLMEEVKSHSSKWLWCIFCQSYRIGNCEKLYIKPRRTS